MPTYCYETKNGEVYERVFRMGKAPRSIMVGNCKAKRAFFAELASVPSSAGWPMPECIASGVNPKQAGELRSFLSRKGVPTEVTKNGNPVYRSKSHRKAALKARGMHDNNSYL